MGRVKEVRRPWSRVAEYTDDDVRGSALPFETGPRRGCVIHHLGPETASLPPAAMSESDPTQQSASPARPTSAALRGMDASLDTGLALETKAIQMLFASQDQKEGMAAFVEKRKPTFKNR